MALYDLLNNQLIYEKKNLLYNSYLFLTAERL